VYRRAQLLCGEMYGSTWIQSFVAVLIVANMMVQIVDVEIHPAPESELSSNLDRVDLMFTIVFAGVCLCLCLCLCVSLCAY
jgi:hypothetical protein